MPLNVHFQQPNKINTQQTKTKNTYFSRNSNRFPELIPIQRLELKIETQSISKSKSKKNPLKSPRTHSFESIALRAMLKQAKKVSPSQTFLPPKSPRTHQGINSLYSKQLKNNNLYIKGNEIQLNGNLKSNFYPLNKCIQDQKELGKKQQENDSLLRLQEQSQEMGSLSRLIFFGDANHPSDVSIVLLNQRISKDGYKQCQQLLKHL